MIEITYKTFNFTLTVTESYKDGITITLCNGYNGQMKYIMDTQLYVSLTSSPIYNLLLFSATDGIKWNKRLL